MNDAGGKSRRGLILTLAVLAVLLLAALITGVALATRDDDDRRERALSATAVTGFIVFEGAKVTATGTYSGTPGGKGAVLVTLVPQGNLLEGPVPIKGNVKVYLDGGRFTATLKGTATPLPNNAFAVKGTAKIIGGTGTYEGATGSFAFDGGQETGEIVGKPKYEGTIEY